jgi:hypothetical protein
MASKVQIVNMALTQLGSNRITNITEDTEQARKANAVYDLVRDEVMAAHPWNFAITRDSLAQLSDTPEYGYDYQYQIPSDCLRVIDEEDYDTDFTIEGDKLLCNESSVNIRYIKRITDTTKYSPGFIIALSARLAAELAYPIAQSRTLAEQLFQVYLDKLKIAKSQDAQEDGIKYYDDSADGQNWLDVRG